MAKRQHENKLVDEDGNVTTTYTDYTLDEELKADARDWFIDLGLKVWQGDKTADGRPDVGDDIDVYRTKIDYRKAWEALATERGINLANLSEDEKQAHALSFEGYMKAVDYAHRKLPGSKVE